MSLISEALKKARGVQPDTYQVAHPPPRRTVAPWLAAAVAVGVAGGLVIGFYVRHDSATPAAAPVEPLVVEAAPAPAAEQETASVSEVDGGAEPTAAPAVPIPPVIAQESVETPVPEVPIAQPTAILPPPEPGPSDGDSYHREVSLPGGARLELGGIAWSERNPAALVNGRVLGLGEGSDDWTLTAVERDRVEIEWRGTRFFLRLK